METIKNYLETMFANMPNTEAVRKAKDELWQMMEDKYNELLADGISENEAIGTVISEFGNLDELAADLGLEKEVEEQNEFTQNNPRRMVSLSEVQDYLDAALRSARMVSAAILLCIICPCPPIILEGSGMEDTLGIAGLFLFLAVAIGLFIYNSQYVKAYSYLFTEPCWIDNITSSYVLDARKKFAPTKAIMKTLGIVLCAFCWLPAAILDGTIELFEKSSGVVLFVMIGVGVYLLVYSARVSRSYNMILNLNDSNTISGTYRDQAQDEMQGHYTNRTVETIMAVYKPSVICIYLIWSFLSFDWYITWIIFPIAWIIKKVIQMNFTEGSNS